MSVFSELSSAPKDPILGMTELFNADTAADKVNLGVGVYLDVTGKVPSLQCVRQVESQLAATVRPRGYLPMDGMPGFNTVVRDLVFGADSPAVQAGRVVSVQALGGTGALRLGAGMLTLASPDAPVLLSDPSWENHALLFTRAGFSLGQYRYYDPVGRCVDVEGMVEDLAAAQPGSIVVLHACCHNPTGYDLTPAEWDRVVDVLVARGLVPFVDLAYQGFSVGVEEDRYVVSRLAETGIPFLVANSFSKTFALYGERVGAIHLGCTDAAEAARVLSQVKLVVRAIYSNPPTHGAAIVSTVLADAELRAGWEQEVAVMRDRIIETRLAFRAGLEAAGVTDDLSHVTTQTGLFSYSGLSVAQMERLRNEFHVYGLDSGRLCIAAINPTNIDRVIAAVADVIKSEA
ncbi:MAG: aspartate/tyrosine/aromatic aminotransferase [Propionibacteriaceae bacterium]|jgi:aromatic-amino-acid transaminase|nr:aspartate/tyrosine/aromatic aminotransferase [Propionibacteriaceae bacterium]